MDHDGGCELASESTFRGKYFRNHHWLFDDGWGRGEVASAVLRIGVKSSGCRSVLRVARNLGLHHTGFLRRFLLERKRLIRGSRLFIYDLIVWRPNGFLMYSVYVGNTWRGLVCCHDSTSD